VVADARAPADVRGMPQPEHQRTAPRPTARANHGGTPTPLRVVPVAGGPVLDGPTRLRLGQTLRALYDPVIDEALDPRLAELLRQLDADRAGGASR
jgi:hypothetical protein